MVDYKLDETMPWVLRDFADHLLFLPNEAPDYSSEFITQNPNAFFHHFIFILDVHVCTDVVFEFICLNAFDLVYVLLL